MKRIIAGMLIMASVSHAATFQDLETEVINVIAAIDTDVAQDIEVVNAINVAVAAQHSLTAGTILGTRGQTVDLPIYFKSGTNPVSSIQFDLTIPPGLVIAGVRSGIAAQAANKGVQGSMTAGGYRTLVFGINQTPIPSGPIAVLQVQIQTSSTTDKKPLALFNMSGSDPIGMGVVLTGKNGSLTVK